jgi:gliding motility-associated-like protein
MRLLDQKIITVIPKIVDFNLSCDAQSKTIEISWPSQDSRCARKYLLYKNNQLVDSTAELQYVFSNLNPGELYDFSVLVRNECGCNDLLKTINCQTLSCESSKPDLSIIQNEYCASLNDSLVRTSVLLPVGFETGKLIYDGIGIDTLGRVNLKLLKQGENKFLVKYQFLDCVNEDSLSVFINPIPVFDLNITQPVCRGEREGTYAVNVSNITAFDLLLNNQVSSLSGRIPTGSHSIGVRSSEGCLASQNFVINPNLDVSYEIQMPESIYDIDPLEAQILLSDSLLSVYDSIVWRLEGEEICNGKNCKELVRYNFEPGRYKIDFLIYYKGCAIGEGRDLTVKSLSKLAIPNILKRRSDNGNDRLILSSLGEGVTIDRIQVFNRWGNLLFNVENVKPEDFEWDLMLQGEALPNDVYILLVEYTNEKGMKLVEKGDFLLID